MVSHPHVLLDAAAAGGDDDGLYIANIAKIANIANILGGNA
jgi:hypothetical protein